MDTFHNRVSCPTQATTPASMSTPDTSPPATSSGTTSPSQNPSSSFLHPSAQVSLRKTAATHSSGKCLLSDKFPVSTKSDAVTAPSHLIPYSSAFLSNIQNYKGRLSSSVQKAAGGSVPASSDLIFAYEDYYNAYYRSQYSYAARVATKAVMGLIGSNFHVAASSKYTPPSGASTLVNSTPSKNIFFTSSPLSERSYVNASNSDSNYFCSTCSPSSSPSASKSVNYISKPQMNHTMSISHTNLLLGSTQSSSSFSTAEEINQIQDANIVVPADDLQDVVAPEANEVVDAPVPAQNAQPAPAEPAANRLGMLPFSLAGPLALKWALILFIFTQHMSRMASRLFWFVSIVVFAIQIRLIPNPLERLALHQQRQQQLRDQVPVVLENNNNNDTNDNRPRQEQQQQHQQQQQQEQRPEHEQNQGEIHALLPAHEINNNNIAAAATTSVHQLSSIQRFIPAVLMALIPGTHPLDPATSAAEHIRAADEWQGNDPNNGDLENNLNW